MASLNTFLKPARSMSPPIVSAFGDTDGEFFGRKIFRPKSFGPNFFRSKKIRPKIFFGRIFFGRKIFARFFSWGGLGGRSRSNHFKKFAKANFLKWCRGGVCGGLPPQETPLPTHTHKSTKASHHAHFNSSQSN